MKFLSLNLSIDYRTSFCDNWFYKLSFAENELARLYFGVTVNYSSISVIKLELFLTNLTSELQK